MASGDLLHSARFWRLVIALAVIAVVSIVRLSRRLLAPALPSGRAADLPPPIAESRWLGWMPSWLRNALILSRRYLGRRQDLTWRVHLPTGLLAVALGIVFAADFALGKISDPTLLPHVYAAQPILRITRLIVAVLFVLVLIFQSLRQRFSLFSTISTFGLFLGTAALVIVLSVMSGFELDLRTKIVGMHAHVTIDREEGIFDDYAKVAAEARADRDVLGASPYLSDEVVVSSPSSSAAVVLKGIDLASINTTSEIGKKLDVGELELLGDPDRLRDFRLPARVLPPSDQPFPSDPEDDAEAKAFEAGRAKAEEELAHGVANPTPPEAPRRALPGILIGRELARSLRVYIGDEVDLVSPQGGIGPTGAIPKSKPFRVAGEFYTGMLEYDSKYAFVALPVAQKFTDRPDEVTGIELKLKDSDATEGVIARLHQALGGTYSVRDWKEINRGLFAALKLEKILMFVALSFIVLVAAFSIIANGVVLVFEKKREIAMLRAMGITTQTIIAVFLLLGLSIGVVGITLGISFGLVGALALGEWGFDLLGNRDVYYLTQLPVRVDPIEIVVIATACFLLVLGATIYPAIVGARSLPADGIRR